MTLLKTALLLVAAALIGWPDRAHAALVPVGLKCNSWVAPLGIDVPRPDLSWTIRADGAGRGVRQTAYQVRVASSAGLLAQGQGDAWNSGKVASDRMLQVKYAGAALASSREYWWQVRVWDEKGVPSAWSQPARWTMGLLRQSEWQARWITARGAEQFAPVIEPRKTDFVEHLRHPATWVGKMPGPTLPNYSSMLLRKEFAAAPRLRRAVAHVCGLGQYELTINGRKVGDQLLTPGWSSYDKTVLYDTYDVTGLLRPGANAVGLLLSNGLYNIQPDTVRYVKMLNTYGPLKAIAQLRLEYADGSVKTIGTDASWQVHPGPVTYMNLYGGEDHDARLEPAGWNAPGFGAGQDWTPALLTTDSAALKGLSGAAAPVRAIARLTPIKATRLNARTWVYDLGQNASIMPEIEVSGARGAFVRLIPAELLKADGTVDRRSATQDGVRPAWWQYTLGTPGRARWFPRFFYQGGRYVQVELFAAPGDTALPKLEKLTGVVVHSSAPAIGQFACSNELFNRIYGLVRWAQRSNMMTVLTDCPHREKMPWLEQYHLNGPSLRYNFDLTTLFTKAMNDMADAQLANGLVPNIAPEYFHAGADWKKNGFRNSPEWGSAFLIVPWQQYLFSGDVTLMQRYYARMKQYLAFLDANSQDGILTIGLGDWYDIGPKPAWGSQLTPTAFTATAIYYYDYEIMAKIATILGQPADAERFARQQQRIYQAFNKAFYQPEKGIYATGSNTTCAMPLFFNLVAPAQRPHLLQTLVDSIRNRHNSFTSGEVGYRFLLRSLADNGYSGVVYDMNNQTDRPGYGYQLKMGVTSLTEKWDASVGSFGSQNHFMSGQINEWFFHDLLGLSPEEDGAGFRRFHIRPTVVGDLTWVKGSYQSVSGPITTEWRRTADALTLQVTVPPNTSATVYVPTAQPGAVREGKNLAAKASGVKFLRLENGAAVYQVGSGSYQFATRLTR
jgi:hypothetical protein